MVHVLSGWCVLRMAVSVLSSVAHLSVIWQSTPLPLTTVLTVDLSLEHVWLMRSGALRYHTLLEVTSPPYCMHIPAACTFYIERSTDFFANNEHLISVFQCVKDPFQSGTSHPDRTVRAAGGLISDCQICGWTDPDRTVRAAGGL